MLNACVLYRSVAFNRAGAAIVSLLTKLLPVQDLKHKMLQYTEKR